MNNIEQSFSVKFDYKIYFTSLLFARGNNTFDDSLKSQSGENITPKIFFVIDDGVTKTHPDLTAQIKAYFQTHTTVKLVPEILVVPGGESSKNDSSVFDLITEAVDIHGIDRHSYIAAIGGGSVLDVVGYASAVSHRGIKHIRIPTTVLSQNDSGVGVKNGINYKGKKNFLGTFAAPVAVFNDDTFLRTLSDRDWRSGISEAIKVALIKDADFFYWIEKNADALNKRDKEIMNYLIHRCAELHVQHISSGDPFEKGSSRPLDFGHWSAHKLEQLTNFTVLHGEAVALGIALDTVYSVLSGHLSMDKSNKVVRLLLQLGFEITHPLLQFKDAESEILKGLKEFQEHLGGRLTIMLLKDIGVGIEVHEMNTELLKKAADHLLNFE